MLNIEQLIIGIFQNRTQAVQAINELHQIGFDNRHIWFAIHGISIGRTLETIKNLMTGQDLSTSGTYDDLINMGMSLEDAQYYQREFNAGHSLVAIQRSGVPLIATSILLRNGGYIINEHFTQFADYGPSPTVQEPTTEDVNAEPDSINEDLAPSSDYGQGNDVKELDKDVVNA